MSYVLVQLRLSPETVGRINDKLTEIQGVHDQEGKILEREAPRCTTEKQIAKLKRRMGAHAQQGRRVTTHNLIRLAIEEGLSQITNPMAALTRLAEEGTPLGRPARGKD